MVERRMKEHAMPCPICGALVTLHRLEPNLAVVECPDHGWNKWMGSPLSQDPPIRRRTSE